MIHPKYKNSQGLFEFEEVHFHSGIIHFREFSLIFLLEDWINFSKEKNDIVEHGFFKSSVKLEFWFLYLKKGRTPSKKFPCNFLLRRCFWLASKLFTLLQFGDCDCVVVMCCKASHLASLADSPDSLPAMRNLSCANPLLLCALRPSLTLSLYSQLLPFLFAPISISPFCHSVYCTFLSNFATARLTFFTHVSFWIGNFSLEKMFHSGNCPSLSLVSEEISSKRSSQEAFPILCRKSYWKPRISLILRLFWLDFWHLFILIMLI